MLIGLTGNIGSGKTALGEIFAKYGFIYLDADTVYHELLEKNTELIHEISKYFPSSLKNDKIDRDILGKLVYGNPERIAQLNQITHPFVIEEMEARTSSGNSVIDALYLFESRFAKKCDYTIAIASDFESRISRIMARDKIDREYAIKKINSQKLNEYYMERADFVIENNQDIKHLEGEIEKWLKTLS